MTGEVYDRLVAVTEDEFAHLQAGRFAELAAAARERAALHAQLPAEPPVRAQPAIDYCAELHARTSAAHEALAWGHVRALVSRRTDGAPSFVQP